MNLNEENHHALHVINWELLELWKSVFGPCP